MPPPPVHPPILTRVFPHKFLYRLCIFRSNPLQRVVFILPFFRENYAWNPYFEEEKPLKFEINGSYADETAQLTQGYDYQWPHSLSEVINSLIKAGLKIQFVNEHTCCAYKMFPFMEQCEDGWWRLKDQKVDIPLMFSLKAIKQ